MPIKIANIIEDGRLAGPQVRILELSSLIRDMTNNQNKTNNPTKTPNNSTISTTVITSNYENNIFIKLLKEKKIPFICLPLTRISVDWKHLLKYVLFFPVEVLLLYLTLRKETFNVVHISGGSWQIKGVIAGKLSGCKVVWHLNDTKMPKIIKFIFFIVATFCADSFITAGRRAKKYYLETHGFDDSKPIFVIQAPVNCNHFNPTKTTSDKYLVKFRGIKILSVGNINPTKGFKHFLLMAAILNKNFEDLNFFIVGPNYKSQEKHFRELLKLKEKLGLSNLSFYGPCADVRRVLKSADVYVCSSIAEASPISVWEAMAMKKGIVATNVGDIDNFISHGHNGFLVSPGNAAELAIYVGKLIENPDLRTLFGERVRKIAVEKLDVSIVARQHIEAYQYMM